MDKRIEALRKHCDTFSFCYGCPAYPDKKAKAIRDKHFGCEFNAMSDKELDYYMSIVGLGKSTEDAVNHPSHYNQGDIECIDAIKASMSPEEYRGFLKGQVIKYVWRYQHKGKPVEDLRKTEFYLDKLVSEMEGVNS